MARITNLTALPSGLSPSRFARDSAMFSQVITTQTANNYDLAGYQPVFPATIAGNTFVPLPTAEDIIVFGIAETITTPSIAIHGLYVGDQVNYSGPIQAAFDGVGNAYLLCAGSSSSHITGVFKLDAARNVSLVAGQSGASPTRIDGTGASASFQAPTSICVAGDGNLYVTESSQTIRKIVPSTGVVTTFAGTSGTAGGTDGTGTAATFGTPNAICYNAFDGALYVADQSGNRIRRVTLAGVVTTVAGSGSAGSANGTGTAASFSSPSGITCDPVSGNLWVTDRATHLIRQIAPGGVVTTIGGTGSAGVADSSGGTGASFYFPYGIVYNPNDLNLYIRQQGASNPIGLTFRRISTQGTNPTATIAGISATPGNQEGGGYQMPALQFSTQGHVTLDPISGALIIAEQATNRFKRLTLDGRISNWAGFTVTASTQTYVFQANQFPAVSLYKVGEVMRTYASAAGQQIWIPLPTPLRVAAGSKLWVGSRNNTTTATNHSLYVAYAPASMFV